MTQPETLILAGGSVVDGTPASSPTVADVVVVDGTIDAIVPPGTVTHGRHIDCAGMVVSPGFIDVHAHSDLTRTVAPGTESRIHQGITTEITGNCGMSASPHAGDPAGLRKVIGPISVTREPGPIWETVPEWLDGLDAPAASNVVALIGHGSLRHATGLAGVADADGIARILRLLEESLDAGCAGMSLGLMYAPGEEASTAELEALATVLAAHDRVLSSHMRSYDDSGAVAAVDEMVALGRTTDVALQLSHIRVAFDSDGEVIRQVLDRLDNPDLDLWADAYPYHAGQTGLIQLLEPALRAAGPARILEIARTNRTRIDTAWRVFDPTDLVVAKSTSRPETVGSSLADLGGDWRTVATDLIIADECDTDIIAFSSRIVDIPLILSHPRIMAGTDGIALPLGFSESLPHPRSYGTFPRHLTVLLANGHDLGSAVHTVTGRPAQRFGLTGRGTIEPGAVADLVVFDPATIADLATYDDPAVAPAGIAHVVVGGEIVLADGAMTAARPGRLIRAS